MVEERNTKSAYETPYAALLGRVDRRGFFCCLENIWQAQTSTNTKIRALFLERPQKHGALRIEKRIGSDARTPRQGNPDRSPRPVKVSGGELGEDGKGIPAIRLRGPDAHASG